MQVIVPATATLLQANGDWCAASNIPESCTLISYVDGRFVPAQARITAGDKKRYSTYRTGSFRHLNVADKIELLSNTGWKKISGLYLGKPLSTGRILNQNQITVPRRLEIFGTDTPADDWFDLLVHLTGSPEFIIPHYFVHLDKPSLARALGIMIGEHYPQLTEYFLTGRHTRYHRKTPDMKLVVIDKESRRLLVHLFARLGIRARRWERSALIIKDEPSKILIADLMGVLRLNCPESKSDTTMKDWIWTKVPQGYQDTFIIDTPTTNLCDGLFIWRTK